MSKYGGYISGQDGHSLVRFDWNIRTTSSARLTLPNNSWKATTALNFGNRITRLGQFDRRPDAIR
jgi:hypothetical protein